MMIIIEKQWKDELLQWNPTDYDNITLLKVPCDGTWTPGILNFITVNIKNRI